MLKCRCSISTALSLLNDCINASPSLIHPSGLSLVTRIYKICHIVLICPPCYTCMVEAQILSLHPHGRSVDSIITRGYHCMSQLNPGRNNHYCRAKNLLHSSTREMPFTVEPNHQFWDYLCQFSCFVHLKNPATHEIFLRYLIDFLSLGLYQDITMLLISKLQSLQSAILAQQR